LDTPPWIPRRLTPSRTRRPCRRRWTRERCEGANAGGGLTQSGGYPCRPGLRQLDLDVDQPAPVRHKKLCFPV
jgi:hypothetical protein